MGKAWVKSEEMYDVRRGQLAKTYVISVCVGLLTDFRCRITYLGCTERAEKVNYFLVGSGRVSSPVGGVAPLGEVLHCVHAVTPCTLLNFNLIQLRPRLVQLHPSQIKLRPRLMPLHPSYGQTACSSVRSPRHIQ